MPRTVEKCYPSGMTPKLRIAGCVLLAAGILLLFVCIPNWAWCALIAVGMIAAGLVLLKLSMGWR